jgi:hypothetical protein
MQILRELHGRKIQCNYEYGMERRLYQQLILLKIKTLQAVNVNITILR